MTLILLPGTLVVVGGLLALARRLLVMVHVVGPSMQPTLREGDLVLAVRRSPTSLTPGRIVVIEQPPPWRTVDSPLGPAGGGRPVPAGDAVVRRRWLIKRVASVPGGPVPAELNTLGARVPAGHIVVLGDNPGRSDDSRRFGFLPLDEVRAVVVWHPAGHRRVPRPLRS
ncbi:signal peptidase I [Verrucosispora sp. WMMA2121]|uniref:signal peptidase I n=1 Tax=Verrucosispora sp. WMMA2121 TaxID=3015164 RepID=UPI0022B6E8D1|nr:signal peptidase I [Verrucosispora sp. WMMA2121]MCZ7418851.1 signal peptidase I [Verrucosispora sp. WMMA2121]